MAAALEEAAGTVCWWGLSPALDLRLYLPAEPAAEASVLLVGAAEGRHLLMTAARARRGEPRDITLFVTERSPEPVARQLLFLLLALEAPERPRPAARAAALLELFGSGSLRSGTAALLSGTAARLRRWVRLERHRDPPRDRDRDGPADLRLMKCRDRDALEAVLRRWERALPVPGAEPGPVPVPGAEPGPVPGPPGWDRRLRRRFGARFEARAAVADWELQMALRPRGAASVSPGEFRLWRETGTAFGGGGATPNPTVLSDPRPRADGHSVSPPAYWGDIATGPFIAFGLGGGGNRDRAESATELSLAAVTELLRELLTGGDPQNGERDPQNGDRDPQNRDPQNGDPQNGDPPQNGDRDPQNGDPQNGDPPQNRDPQNGDPPQNGDRDPQNGDRDPPGEDSDPLGPLAPLPIRIRFLPLGDPPATPARLGGRCQLLVLGWRSLPALTPALAALAAPGATLLVELPTLVPSLRPAQLGALRARAAALAGAGGFEPWGGPGEPPAHLRFRKGPSAETPDPNYPKEPGDPSPKSPETPDPNYPKQP